MHHPEAGRDEDLGPLADGVEVRQAVHQPLEADRILQSKYRLSFSKIVIDEVQVSGDEFPQVVLHSFLQSVEGGEVLSAGRAGTGELVLRPEPLLPLLSGCLQERHPVGISHLLSSLDRPESFSFQTSRLRLRLPGSEEYELVVVEDSDRVVIAGVVEEREEREDSTANTLHLHHGPARAGHHSVHLVTVTPHPRLVSEDPHTQLLPQSLLLLQEPERHEALLQEQAGDGQLQPLPPQELSLVGQQGVEAGDWILL